MTLRANKVNSKSRGLIDIESSIIIFFKSVIFFRASINIFMPFNKIFIIIYSILMVDNSHLIIKEYYFKIIITLKWQFNIIRLTNSFMVILNK